MNPMPGVFAKVAAVVGRRAGAAALGLAIDRALGEPPNEVHPVALFGKAMTKFETTMWADRRDRGALYTATGIGLGLMAGRLVRSTAVAVAVAVAARELRAVAAGVGEHLTTGDDEAARAALPSLVGRDPSALDSSAMSAAVIESVAENAVDAVVAPLWWAAIGGAPGVLAYRAANTMDAMVGHHSERFERFGWASARLDDVANWIPARLYALVVAATNPHVARRVMQLVGRDAAAHPSPNAGVAETAMAAALGRELGGPLRYDDRVENRPSLGDGPRPQPADIERALTIASRVEWALAAGLAATWALTWPARRR